MAGKVTSARRRAPRGQTAPPDREAHDFLGVARLYPTRAAQCALDNAAAVEAGRAELLHVSAPRARDGERPGSGHAERCFFYRVTATSLPESGRPAELCALAILRRRVPPGAAGRSGPQTAVSRGPALLSIGLADGRQSRPGREGAVWVPPFILSAFDNELYFGDGGRRLYALLRQPDTAAGRV